MVEALENLASSDLTWCDDIFIWEDTNTEEEKEPDNRAE